MTLGAVVQKAQDEKREGATRFCMGAAWRHIKDGPEFDRILEMVCEVDKLGLEVCCTLGMLNPSQAKTLKDGRLHSYNHNIDTSKAHYSNIITTRVLQDRLDTLRHVRSARINVCAGGILGLGESDEDRIEFLHRLANLGPPPESVPINVLMPFEGTPLADQAPISHLIVVRTIATARIVMPKAMIRLSAGRINMSESEQLLCFYCGANSIFTSDKLLTAPNATKDDDKRLFAHLGLKPASMQATTPFSHPAEKIKRSAMCWA